MWATAAAASLFFFVHFLPEFSKESWQAAFLACNSGVQDYDQVSKVVWLSWDDEEIVCIKKYVRGVPSSFVVLSFHIFNT